MLLLAILGVLSGAYAAVAAIGIRQLEQQWVASTALHEELDEFVREQRRGRRIGDLRVSANPELRIQDAATAYRKRVAELRGRAARVTAVDPGVRRLRRAIVDGLAKREGSPLVPLGDEAAEEALAGQLARLHLGKGRHAPPPSLALAGIASSPFASVPTGDRIMVELEDALVEVDVDGGQGRVVDGSGVLGMAGVGRSVVFVDRSKAKVAEAGNPERPRVLGDADEVWSRHDGHSVWLVTVDEGDDEEVEDEKATLMPIDVADGRKLAEAWTVDGRVVAASSRYVAVAHFSARGSRVEVWDAERRAVVHRIPNGDVLELVGTMMVWQAFDPRALNTGGGVPPLGPVHVTDIATGNDRTFTGPPGSGAGVVMLSPDRSRLAVLWEDDVAVLALDDLREVVSVALPGNRVTSAVTWSADGRRLWLSLDDVEGEGVVAVLDVATRRLEELPLRGVIYDIVAF